MLHDDWPISPRNHCIFYMRDYDGELKDECGKTSLGFSLYPMNPKLLLGVVMYTERAGKQVCTNGLNSMDIFTREQDGSIIKISQTT
mmetsp:Transcript_8362/g.19403  ORF Transcript_8362/g.19403 Transcript_8362/m.19403 type:complete len:87 (+) Transcript_8362:683-943(+)